MVVQWKYKVYMKKNQYFKSITFFSSVFTYKYKYSNILLFHSNIYILSDIYKNVKQI